MLFNSVDFAIFLPIVFILYWFVTNKNLKLQNLLIVISSYLFYGWWDWRFLLLIVFSTLLDFTIGNYLSKEDRLQKRKQLLWLSVGVNLGFLGFFKYYNFFVQSFTEAFTFFGNDINAGTLEIILPVGISFYTFQTLSYTIDVYKKQLGPTKDIVAFSAFVCFFPQLVAGPIERATNLLPQFYVKRTFNYANAADGLRQVLWGFFKKLVIADNCSTVVNALFDNPTDHSGSTLLLGAIFFSFQIYCDFSGYSDIAIGVSRLFGFDLMQNFAFPYFSRDIAEFWRRWHISLSTWFRDYIYFPLGGSKRGKLINVRNIMIVFLVSGFWHGANWTYIFWGGLNALLFLPMMIFNRNRNNIDFEKVTGLYKHVTLYFRICYTFLLTSIVWVFFRAETIDKAFVYIKGIFSSTLFTDPVLPEDNGSFYLQILLPFLLIEWFGRYQKHPLELLSKEPKLVRILSYALVLLAIGFLMKTEESPFIYFQF